MAAAVTRIADFMVGCSFGLDKMAVALLDQPPA